MMKEYRSIKKLMGSVFEFILVAGSDAAGERLLQKSVAEVERIEKLLTEFQPDSETSRINREAGNGPVTVSSETFELIKRSRAISELTNGAFDITAAALKKIYRFTTENFIPPSERIIRDTLDVTGYRQLKLIAENQVQLTKKGAFISFAAIGKGYAADAVKKMLLAEGVKSAVINASGDLTVWGNRSDGRQWRVGIADPLNPANVLLYLPVSNAAIATSGNYIQYYQNAGKRYSHNINPLTGEPVTEIISATVISPAAELSDALATAVSVMGVREALRFIDQLPQTHAIIINAKNELFTSGKINWSNAA